MLLKTNKYEYEYCPQKHTVIEDDIYRNLTNLIIIRSWFFPVFIGSHFIFFSNRMSC